MRCHACKLSIPPEIEIRLGPDDGPTCCCPYCLTVLTADTGAHADAISIDRLEQRRRVRDAFVDSLSSGPGERPRCPICERELNKSDEILLRSTMHFRCHTCAHDLAMLAYRRVAFDETHWLPLIDTLADVVGKDACDGCVLVGAMASACTTALGHISRSLPVQHALLRRTLARTDWTPANDVCAASCSAVAQYRESTGMVLRLL